MKESGLIVCSLAWIATSLALPPLSWSAQPPGDTANVTGTFVLPKDVPSFDGHVVEIRLYKIHPMIADKAADLVEEVLIEKFAHVNGKETRKEFTIGAKAKREPEMMYYITLFILKDGQRTHIGEVPGQFLCKVLTLGNPSSVTMTVKKVR